ncbi:hypothetical protein BD311DRAFT_763202 [Dichomitus squalens]|uniref:Uncharacterized protein n=1 Tax=Dichomitus squalens TaxID=114155 RepID=A0A4Q9MFL6_9APHY|nr:hypothetical protein BD311DRAFT_763202 [Dichomitus squalens]
MSPSPRRRGLPVVVDDTDSELKYMGDWSRQTPSPGQLNNTVTGTVENGASVSFTFKGTSIKVYGQQIPNDTQNSTYMFNGQSFTYFMKDAIHQQHHQVQFFSSPTIGDGEHTIYIINHGDSLLIDYLEVVIDGSIVSSSPSPHTTHTSAKPTMPSRAAPSSAPQQVLTSTHSASGAIVAAFVVLGVFMFSLLLGIAVYIFWRWRCKQLSSSAFVTPFQSAGSTTDVSSYRSKKSGLLDRDPFRNNREQPPVYGYSAQEMPNTIFAYDDGEHEVDVPRSVLLSALKRVPQPQRVSIASTPVLIATLPNP